MSIALNLPACTGVGFKPAHFCDILAAPQPLGFFEVHAENYMGAGGPPHAQLGALREHYALSVHGVGLSIGSMQPLNRDHLMRLKMLCDRYEPESFSEHLAWSSHDDVYLNDLLPLPYTQQTLARVAEHIDEVQTALGRQMLLENPSTYIRFSESTIPEVDFLTEVSKRTGCGLLLDINNVFVSAKNHGTHPLPYLDSFPFDQVKEIHLGGHDEETDDVGAPLLIDTHGSPIAEAVWTLYAHVVARAGALPTLIEWDNDVPDWPTLLAEAVAAQDILSDASRAPAA
ncbi:MAG TPA: DUF692 domain-containing protein [Bradyrhizobium sp.]|jgi:uncharacterized protein (UPF0276 family)|uniref:MNIO family bufferin maturase n=1 Tax=Bradyrhizobium sp. TaxID=376 RepID=UPI002B8C1D31|nr:DUF692 domain-containing protein [Bradyrhizobium sp.]HXB77400.1 DUF692 domain-containing protein [Bradyrhizobium sp.]